MNKKDLWGLLSGIPIITKNDFDKMKSDDWKKVGGIAAAAAATYFSGGAAAPALGAAGAGAAGAGAAGATTAGMTAAEILAATAGVAEGEAAIGGLLAAAPEAAMAPEIAAASKGLLATGQSQGLMGHAYNALMPGMGSEQAGLLAQQTGEFGLEGLGKTMQAASRAQGLSPGQATGSDALGGLLSKTGSMSPKEAMNMKSGMDLLMPQQQQPQSAPPPRQQSQNQEQPLTNPYGPGGNSLGLNNMTEAEKRRLRAMGYQV